MIGTSISETGSGTVNISLVNCGVFSIRYLYPFNDSL